MRYYGALVQQITLFMLILQERTIFFLTVSGKLTLWDLLTRPRPTANPATVNRMYLSKI